MVVLKLLVGRYAMLFDSTLLALLRGWSQGCVGRARGGGHGGRGLFLPWGDKSARTTTR